MSYSRHTIDLWRRSKPFNFLSIAAVVSTVIAMWTGSHTASGASNTTGGNSVHQTGNASGPHTGLASGGNVNSQSISCGPLGGVQLQSPLLVAQGGSAPSNVTIPANGASSGIPRDTESRFIQFITNVDAANKEPRSGERCAHMQGILDLLEPEDYAYAACFDKAQAKLTAVKQCSLDFKASEARFGRLLNAAGNAEKDSSASRVIELATARSRMTPFDENREYWQESALVIAAGDNAIEQLADSDQRISSLKNAYAVHTKNNDLASLSTFADASQLQPFDLSRLSEREKSVLHNAKDAYKKTKASDQRLSELEVALRSLQKHSKQSENHLVEKIGNLTDFDESRATASQRVDIENARKSAAEFALDSLIETSNEFEISSAAPEQLKLLHDLRSVVVEHMDIGTLNEAQQAALKTAANASIQLDLSNKRISQMQAAASSLSTLKNHEEGEQILQIVSSITEFDKSNMDAVAKRDFQALTEARNVVLATQERIFTKEVPLYIHSSRSQPEDSKLIDSLQTKLASAGYALVSSEEESALKIELLVSPILRKVSRVGSVKIKTAEISVSMQGYWTFANEPLISDNSTGVGRSGNDPDTAAINDATDQLIDSLASITKG